MLYYSAKLAGLFSRLTYFSGIELGKFWTRNKFWLIYLFNLFENRPLCAIFLTYGDVFLCTSLSYFLSLNSVYFFEGETFAFY